MPELSSPTGRAAVTAGAATIAVAVFIGVASYPAQLIFVPLIAIAALAGARLWSTGELDLFEPLWFFLLLFTVGYFWGAAFLESNPVDFSVYPVFFVFGESPTPSVLAAVIGFGAFVVGYTSSFHLAVARLIPDFGDAKVSARRLTLASFLFVGIGLVSLYVVAGAAGLALTPGSLFNPQVRQALLASMVGAGPLFIAILVIPLFTITVFAVYLREPLTPARFLTITGLAGLTLFCMGFVGGRIYLLSFALGMVLVWNYRRRRLGLATQLAVLSASGVLGAVFGVLLFQGFTFSPYDLLRRIAGTFDSHEILRVALRTAPSPLWGLTVIEDVTITYLPRALFPGKPFVYGVVRAQEAILPGLWDQYGDVSTYPPSILAEGYVNFGWAGIILFPVIAGILVRAIFETGLRRGGGNLALAVLMFGQMLTLLRSLGAFLVAVVVYSAFAFIAFRLRMPLPRREAVP